MNCSSGRPTMTCTPVTCCGAASTHWTSSRDVVLAHSWTAVIDASAAVTTAVRYRLATASLSAPERFRSLLYEVGGDETEA